MLACWCWCTRVSATGKSATRSRLGPMVVEAKAMRCRDEGETRIGLGLEGVVNLYRRTGLGFGREVHVEWYSAGHPGTPGYGRGAGWDVSSSRRSTYAWGMDMGLGIRWTCPAQSIWTGPTGNGRERDKCRLHAKRSRLLGVNSSMTGVV
jgi:hypothetical protein